MDWKNAKLPLEERLDDLIERLHLKEKIALLDDKAPAIERVGLPHFKYGGEALHGLCNTGRATLFPMPIGMAAGFDPELIQRIASATGDEMRAKYHSESWAHAPSVTLLVYSPVINIYRDPRWGRGQETYGEDPYLTGALGAAFVRGLQGDHPKYLKLAACAKHLGVHSGPEALRRRFNAEVSEKDLRETYLYAFRELIEAGVRSVMATYNRVNGEHCCAHSHMIGRILREEWGFDGVILSDGGALESLHTCYDSEGNTLEGHKLTHDLVETAALCLREQCDLELGTHAYRLAGEAIERGLITEAEVDRAVRRILRLRFELGVFDPPEDNPYTHIPLSVIQSPQHLRLAREAARKSIVLLKNDQAALPLRDDRDRTVLVTGPTSVDLQVLLGNFYKGSSGQLSSLLEGITAEAPEGVLISHSQGCFLNHPNTYDSDWFLGLTEWADAIVACVGYSPLMEGEQGECIGAPDGGDKSSIALPENQLKFLRQLREKADSLEHRPRLIVVVTGGGPLELEEVVELSDALLLAWYPGQEGGNALGEILWGRHSPSGKLPVTFPRKLSDLPAYENYSMQGRSYRFMDPEKILFPFGFGLSYTQFHYGEIETIQTDDGLTEAHIQVSNTGDKDGETIVQIYSEETDGTHLNSSLVGFQRVCLTAGQTQKLLIKLRKLPANHRRLFTF